MPRAITLHENIRPILGAIRSIPVSHRPPSGWDDPQRPAAPFVTLSREPGAGAWSSAQPLVDALNAAFPSPEQPWTWWDRELVEKVAADHHIAKPLIDSLEESHHSWLTDFLSGLCAENSEFADEALIFSKVASAIRALANTGRVVIVGRGGVFITRQMPGGVHVRLVAPLEKRIERMAAFLNVSRDKAAATVRDMTRTREAFYRRYWPQEPIRPELFTATLNTAAMSPETVVSVIVELVRERVVAAASAQR